MSASTVLLIVGVVWLALWRWGHDSGKAIFGRWTVLPSTPAWLRRIGRSGNGDVNILAVANEVWALAFILTGLVLQFRTDISTGDDLMARSFLSLILPLLIAAVYGAWRRVRAGS